MATEVWSEEAKCYKVIEKNGKTFLYYICCLTGKKTTLHYNGTGLHRKSYVGRITKLIMEI